MKITAFICSILLILVIFVVPRIYAGGGSYEPISTSQSYRSNLNDEMSNDIKSPNVVYKTIQTIQTDGFLSDVLAFQTALLALLIPLSFDVISRISDRYKSEIIIRRFQRERIFLSLTGTLIVNITYMLFLRFFNNSTQMFSVFSLFLALLSIVLLSLFLLLVSNYTNISYIKKKLLRNATNVIK